MVYIVMAKLGPYSDELYSYGLYSYGQAGVVLRRAGGDGVQRMLECFANNARDADVKQD